MCQLLIIFGDSSSKDGALSHTALYWRESHPTRGLNRWLGRFAACKEFPNTIKDQQAFPPAMEITA